MSLHLNEKPMMKMTEKMTNTRCRHSQHASTLKMIMHSLFVHVDTSYEQYAYF